MNQDQERIKQLVAHWAPEFSRETETFSVQVLRAFMEATACAASQAEKLAGKEPVRPIESFPDPLFGFRFGQKEKAA